LSDGSNGGGESDQPQNMNCRSCEYGATDFDVRQLREIRFPEGKNNVQIRMWRPGDFRETGNNVVTLSGAGAHVISVDRHLDHPASSRFVRAMTALHYNEWGGISIRLISAAAGLLTPVFYLTGILMWWYKRPRRPVDPRPESVVDAREVMAVR